MATARRLLCAATLITLAACAMAQTASPPAQTAITDSWQLSFHLSGGFAGVDQRLELASTGALTARDRRRGTDVSARAPAEDMARIAALLADLKAIDSGGRSTCRDCFEYDIEIQTRGRSLVFHLQDTSLSNSGMEPLVKALNSLLDDAVAGRLTGPQAPR